MYIMLQYMCIYVLELEKMYTFFSKDDCQIVCDVTCK